MSATAKATFDIHDVMELLKEAFPSWNAPVVTFMGQVERHPFKVLVATLISLRTKDEVTGPASLRLFDRAPTPEALAALAEEEIARLIYPAGFYRNKAKTIRAVCAKLLAEFEGKVPDDVETLLTLPGVGRKTANLVVAAGFGKPAICVDVHVHRITNRWGYLRTKNPEETEFALREKLPAEHWAPFNSHLVAFGQTICKPVSPYCSKCPVAGYCMRRNVTTSR